MSLHGGGGPLHQALRPLYHTNRTRDYSTGFPLSQAKTSSRARTRMLPILEFLAGNLAHSQGLLKTS